MSRIRRVCFSEKRNAFGENRRVVGATGRARAAE